MGYILELRKLIGSRPIIMCGAGVIILDTENRILLQHRKDNDCWGIPGGSVELGEETEDTARREVFEETGLKVGKLQLVGVYSGPKLYYKYPNGDEVYNVAIIYTSCEYEGALCGDLEETKGVEFFKPDALPKKINPPDQLILEDFVTRLEKSQTKRNIFV